MRAASFTVAGSGAGTRARGGPRARSAPGAARGGGASSHGATEGRFARTHAGASTSAPASRVARSSTDHAGPRRLVLARVVSTAPPATEALDAGSGGPLAPTSSMGVGDGVVDATDCLLYTSDAADE